MWFIVKGTKGAISFQANTGWFLHDTEEFKKESVERFGWSKVWGGWPVAVGVHSLVPVDGHIEEENCDWLQQKCWYGACYTCSDEPFKILVEKGSDALWEYLEAFYNKNL